MTYDIYLKKDLRSSEILENIYLFEFQKICLYFPRSQNIFKEIYSDLYDDTISRFYIYLDPTIYILKGLLILSKI